MNLAEVSANALKPYRPRISGDCGKTELILNLPGGEP